MIYTCQSRRGVKLRRCVPTIGIGVLLADRGNAMEAGPLNAVELGMDWAMILRKIVSFELMPSTTETALPLAFYGGTTATVGYRPRWSSRRARCACISLVSQPGKAIQAQSPTEQHPRRRPNWIGRHSKPKGVSMLQVSARTVPTRHSPPVNLGEDEP